MNKSFDTMKSPLMLGFDKKGKDRCVTDQSNIMQEGNATNKKSIKN